MRPAGRLTFAAIAIVLAVVVSTAASAGTPGGGRLQFSHIRGSKPTTKGPLTVTLRFFRKVVPDTLRPATGNAVRLLIDIDSDRAADFVGRIRRVPPGRLVMLLSSKSGDHYEPLRVRRPGARSLRTTIPGGAPMNPKGGLWIRATSVSFTGPGCSGGCRDAIPQSGWLHLRVH